MKAYVFPGQGAQFSGMGKDLFDNSPLAKELFLQANDILGFNITDVMFSGTDEELKQTKVTQPAIFLHSTILAACLGDTFRPDMVAGHSLGEFSALVANKSLRFEDGLKLVYQRALAMQKATLETLGVKIKEINDERRVSQPTKTAIDRLQSKLNVVAPKVDAVMRSWESNPDSSHTMSNTDSSHTVSREEFESLNTRIAQVLNQQTELGQLILGQHPNQRILGHR